MSKKEPKIKTFVNGLKRQWHEIKWADNKKLKEQTIFIIIISAVLSAVIFMTDFSVLHLIEKIF